MEQSNQHNKTSYKKIYTQEKAYKLTSWLRMGLKMLPNKIQAFIFIVWVLFVINGGTTSK